MAYRSINPFNGQILKLFENQSEEEVARAVTSAQICFDTSWGKTAFAHRSKIVGRVAALMLERKEELARLATMEMGKRISEARLEVDLSASILQYYAKNAERFLAPKRVASVIADAHVEYSPLGVLLGVQPWNFPYYQLIRFAAPNLMAGNTVLIKHSSVVPQCALAVETLFRDAGAPSGAYTNLFIPGDKATALLDDPRIKGVALTGSEAAGVALASGAGRNLKPATMELGGSDAFIILEDCDLEFAVHMAVLGRMGNTGQTCIGAKRFIVVGPRADHFLEAFSAALGQLQPGDPMDEGTTLGPLSSEGALNDLIAQVKQAVGNGARVVCGGDRIARPGSFMQPTILTDVTRGNPAFHQEFFGPVALFFHAKDEEEAISLANDSPFGLGGSVYSQNLEHAKRVASRLETGMVFINYPFMSAPELPFGGIKRSGFGTELSEFGIREFVNRKLVAAVPQSTSPIQGA